MTRGMAWRHVPTELNPANIISRGCTPKELLDSVLWLHGPPFLAKSITEWPKPIEVLRCLPELRVTTLAGSAKLDVSINCKYHNSFGKLQRIFAYVFRFLSSCKKDIRRTRGALTVHEVSEGTSLLIKGIQQVHFFEEHKALSVRKPIPLKSKLLSLRPELGPDGLLRVGGRLQNSFLDYDAMHPIILPKDHAGNHVMGRLPADRIQPNPAFHTAGMDFCGPFFYKAEARNKSPHKCYISVHWKDTSKALYTLAYRSFQPFSCF
ncbi:hypothetical protein ACLKA6_016151 [Drosophila palustris]